MSAGLPLVSVGVPVRNGAETLGMALDSIIAQTYTELEIIVSDNASDDDTGRIADEYACRDPRVRVVHQPIALKMLENFEATFRAATGRYLVWLAHDDLLQPEFVERTVAALECEPGAVLAFGTVDIFTDYETFADRRRVDHRFATSGMPVWRRLVRERNSGWEVKGLIRREALDGYRWWEHSVSPDWPLLTHLQVVGDVIDVPGAELWVGYRAELKTTEERAALQSYAGVERFPLITLAWRSALAARDAGAKVGRRRLPAADFILLLGGLLWASRGTLVSAAAWRARAQRLRASRPS